MLLRALVLAALACACVPARPPLGEIRLRPYAQLAATPAVFSVQQGRLFNPGIDLTIDDDGCIRGVLRSDFVQLCSKPQKRDPNEEDGKIEHWAGTFGDITTELYEKGKKLRVDGYLRTDGVPMTVQTTIPLGAGPQWDELRKYPALLAIAAAVSGISGEPGEHSQAE